MSENTTTSLQEKNILFFTGTMNRGGTERVIVQLCKILKDKVGKIVVCSKGGVGVKLLEEIGIKHITIPDIRAKNPVNICRCTRILKRIVKEENINVIHTHHRMSAFYATILKWYKKYTVINTCHNVFNDKKAFNRFAYKHLHLIAVGEQVKKNVVEFYGLPSSQVTVIHNAVEPFIGEIQPVPTLQAWRKDGCVIAGYSGRLSPVKGLEYFVQAMPIVKQSVPNAKFAIVGDGEEKARLTELVKALEMENDVVFLGYRTDVQNVIGQMDVIVLPSLTEGLPLTPIEAFSVGRPVVATAVDGTPEVVQDGKNGYLISTKNAGEIADKLIQLMLDKRQRICFGESAKQRYEEEFSFAMYAKRITEYYQTVCK
ncbi:MAG: glycosyltransferase family 4 protein [Clostridia bacterium]|nr:glycosyltransferase family 4 protein [Clostridia bacterium]